MTEEEKKQALYDKVRTFVDEQDIHCEEVVYQTDRVIVAAYDFIADLCNVVGFKGEDA